MATFNLASDLLSVYTSEMKRYLTLAYLLASAIVIRFLLLPVLETSENELIIGALRVVILVGTAFPDMVLGVIAALLSVKYRTTDMSRSINYAIIASATTFGSNIYNIGHATWCILRQNIADVTQKHVIMFPFLPSGGFLTPLKKHPVRPSEREIGTAASLLTVLSVITSLVAISMVVFGRVSDAANPTSGDLYQLIVPIEWVIFFIAIATLWHFRKNMRDPQRHTDIIQQKERFYAVRPTYVSLIALAISAVAILFAAESMVKGIEELSIVTGMPFVVAGVLAGIIGCLGEMLVVHNFSISPKGRIGDAIVGVAMDNIVTILGAGIVAMIGGIFLGGNALILIFVIILCLNTVLLWQIGKLQKTILKL